ncbi:exopolygalacturonase clone GBGE184-like [Corylus avellana]|uniref:exopolygalacturonase clone GBGE184-like n=1 Tax=Corylus avellana TaxID=13451 RepID=UPI001E231C4F|nr:exopolygalacturonase clone GBGE184-like [Corylus avellana]
MSTAQRFVLFLGVALFLLEAEATSRSRRALGDADADEVISAGPSTVFNVNSFGATADGSTNNAKAFMKAWIAACKSGGGPSTLVFPKGTYVSGPVIFAGPCKGTITVQVQGTIKATTDLSDYDTQDWFLFESIDGLILTGGGTFDGQGQAVWKYNDCHQNPNCQLLPTSISFFKVKNAQIHGITSLNSKSFHTHVSGCENMQVHDLTVIAPGNSPNTDGMHVSRSNLVNISSSTIGTGDDCISIGQGTTHLSVTDVHCGPGHGFSVGSLGKYPNELDVSGIVVSHSSLKGTTNGVRIKSWPGSSPSRASGIIFDDITMDAVKNPIIIDQKYGSQSITAPSRVQISDVHYKNIRGTTISNVAVSFICSSAVPCQGIEMVDINLQYKGEGAKVTTVSASCENAKIKYGGKQSPPPCVQ